MVENLGVVAYVGGTGTAAESMIGTAAAAAPAALTLMRRQRAATSPRVLAAVGMPLLAQFFASREG